MLQANSYHRGKARDSICPLLVFDQSAPREVEQHHDAMHDFILIDLLEHLVSLVSVSLEFISRMCPLFVGLDPMEGEVHRHHNSIQPLAIYQC